jgi:hypothetical protein
MPAAQLSDGICNLPGGLVLDDGRRLGRAELRPLTGREEEWVAQHSDTPSALMSTKILSACFVRLDEVPVDSDIIRKMLVGDRDFLILQLRRMTFGERFAAVFPCQDCKVAMDVEFLAQDILVEPRPQDVATYTWQFQEPARTRPPVRFRLPNGADQEAVANLGGNEAADVLLARCVIDDGGTPLTHDECVAVIAEMDRLAPQIDLELDLNCPECGHSFTAPFDCTAFFFSEIRAQSRYLMREVHYLALHYHWSEAEILDLQRHRRRDYLALLNETLRPN